MDYYHIGAYRGMKIIGKVITKQILNDGKVVMQSHVYNVQAVVELGGKPAYVTTKIYENHPGWIEYLVIVDLLVDDYIPKFTSAIMQSHYELECKCKHDDVEACELCKQLLQSMYPDIPFEGEGI